MEAVLISAGVIFLAEIGDKTQLMALVLAARYRRALPIVAGILVATVVNHSIAAAIGVGLSALLAPEVLRWIVALAFFAMAAWVIVPDGDDIETIPGTRLGVFGTTVVAFFIAEMGDKTQLATVALVVQFETMLLVVMGSTLGMMLANAPAVFVGDRIARKLPIRALRITAAVLFIVLGVLALAGAGQRWGF